MSDKNPRPFQREDSELQPQEPGEPAAIEHDSKTIVDPLAGPGARESVFKPSVEQVQPGEMLAGRFQVIRFLGSGGMGEVFEAEDQTLGEAVALKLVRSGIENAASERRRLRREVQLARKVTHTNVCRIYDLFEHRNPRTLAPLDLVSMELLEGETLHQRRRRQGRMPPAQALPIVRQIARGLNAAHKLGIVHRDLKPGNVMLEQEKDAGLRAAITDFGLAKRIGLEGPPDTSLTGEGSMIGSPGYMAPEQVAAEPSSPATDIFSLGLLLFEMLTGRLPYTGASPWQIAISRLQNPPTPLTIYLPDIDPSILAVVDRCLKRDPQQRFQSALEFLARLDRGDSVWNVYGHKGSDSELVAAAPSDSAPVGSAESSQQAPLPPSEEDADSLKIRRAAAPEPLPSGASPAEASPAAAPPAAAPPAASSSDPIGQQPPAAMGPDRIRGLSAAQWRRQVRWAAVLAVLGCLVFVSFRWWSTQSQLDLAANVAGLTTDRVLPVVVDVTTPAGLAPAPTPPPELTIQEATQRADALERARVHMDVHDAEPARLILEAAIDALPADPTLDVRLTEAMWRLGHEEKLRSVIERAYAMSASLPEPERLFITALHQGFLGDWETAAETFKALWLASPSLEVGLWIIEATINSGRFDPLPEILRGLRALPGQDGSDIRIDLWQSRVSQRFGEYEAAEAMAQRVVELAEARGHSHLLFESLLELHLARNSLGRDFEARNSLLNADRLARELDQPFVLAEMMRLKGRNFNIAGYHQEALLELEEADALFEQQGSSRGVCGTSFQHAMIDRPQENLVERLERGLEACSRIGFRLDEAWANHNLARMARDAGDFARAVALFRRSAQLMEQLDNNNGLAHSRVSLSLLLAQMGRIDEALANLSIAEVWFRRSPKSRGFSLHLILSAEIAIRAGRLPDARAWLAEATAFELTGSRLLDLYKVQCELAYTKGDLEALRLAAAGLKQHARVLAVQHSTNLALGYEALSFALDDDLGKSLEKMASVDPASSFGGRMALLYLQAGDPENAAEAFRAYATWTQSAHNQEEAWFAEIVRIQLDGGASRQASSEQLFQIETKARANGHRSIEIQAALVRGTLEDDQGQLAEVRDRASKYGFTRLANQAARLLGSLHL